MKFSKLTGAIIVVLGGVTLSSVALASDSDSDVRADLSRIDENANSGSGHNVITECGSFPNASGTIKISTAGGSSKVKLAIKDAIPNTHFTVWLRLKAKDRDGNTIGPAPLTGGGATPLAATTDLESLADDFQVGGGSANSVNGFTTDGNGDGSLKVKLDFPMSSGSYPFNRMSQAALDKVRLRAVSAEARPAAIVDPRESGITSAPFLIRVVSHCQDGLGHGFSPGDRESWFQFP